MTIEDLQKKFNKEFTDQAIVLDKYMSKCNELEQKLSACEIVLEDTQKEVCELKEVIYKLRHSVKLFIEMKGYTKAQVDIPAFVKALENFDNMYKQ